MNLMVHIVLARKAVQIELSTKGGPVILLAILVESLGKSFSILHNKGATKRHPGDDRTIKVVQRAMNLVRKGSEYTSLRGLGRTLEALHTG